MVAPSLYRSGRSPKSLRMLFLVVIAILLFQFRVVPETAHLKLELYDPGVFLDETQLLVSSGSGGSTASPAAGGSPHGSSTINKKTTGHFKVVKEELLSPKVFTVDQTNFTIDYFSNMPECAPLSPDQVTFTLTTQLSLDRLWIMEDQCKRWPSPLPISIAIYLPATATEASDAVVEEKFILQRLNHEFHCDLSRMTVILFQAAPNSSPNQYPVNLLRNLALEAIPTTHAVYVDSDFLISDGLHNHLINTARDILASDDKALVVIPAFDYISECRHKTSQEHIRQCLREEWKMVPEAYDDILNLLDRKDSFPHVDRGFQTIHGQNKYHGTTLYRTWARNQSTVVSIPCISSHTYEPYMAMRVCRDLAIFPEQFRGWGHNKVTWVKILLKKLGYRLWQLPKGFVVHIPHQVSASRKSNADGRPIEFEGYLHWLKHLPVHPESLPLCYDWKKLHGERDP